MFKQTKPIILASKSPRRQELLTLMGLDFTVELREVDESYPEGLGPGEIAVYIAEKKAGAFEGAGGAIVVTADTIVAVHGEILGKPTDRQDAQRMLRLLSGTSHQVFTGVTLVCDNQSMSFHAVTEVVCRAVTDEEILNYIDNFSPYDKAGSYGIQDWWGLAAVQKINGSYTNVMGLPTERLYAVLANSFS